MLLIFFHPECHFCGKFLVELASLQKFGELAVLPLFISTGDPEKNRRLFDQHEIRFPVLLEEDAELASLLRIPGTPVGYLVNESGATAAEMLVGEGPLLAALRPLCAPATAVPGGQSGKGKFTRSLTESRIVRDGLRAGTPAPDFTLPALDGGKIALNDYRGQKVLLVFSDPECQPCSRLAPELEQIHRHSQGLRVLMVSRGDRAANQAKTAEHGLSFPIALQRHWEISRAYGMFATPIAYFIDEEGIVASDVAAGLEPIVQLASAAKSAHACDRGSTFRRQDVAGRQWQRHLCCVLPRPGSHGKRVRLVRCRLGALSLVNNLPGATLVFAREDWDHRPFRPLPQDEDLWFILDQTRAGAVAVPVRSESCLHSFLAMRHGGVSKDRGHTWIQQADGRSLEDYLHQERPLYRTPEQLLPGWALDFYQDLRADMRASA